MLHKHTHLPLCVLTACGHWTMDIETELSLIYRPRSTFIFSGRGPTGLRARVRNRSRLENRSHVVPKTEFQDGGDRTWIFTHKITILA